MNEILQFINDTAAVIFGIIISGTASYLLIVMVRWLTRSLKRGKFFE